jgi:hypothetical protein
MKRLLRCRPSPALVIACIALFVALGPAAYATHELINSSDVVDNSLQGVDVQGTAGTATTAAINGSLTGADISGQAANAAVGQPFIDGSLTGHDITNGSLGSADYGDSSIQTADIAPKAINGTKVADGSLNGTNVADGGLTGTDVLDDSVTGADIYEPSLSTVPSAGNAATLGGVSPSAFMRARTRWKSLRTIGERYPIEIGNPACSGNRLCTAQLRCDTGDVLLSGGFQRIDSGTRIFGAFPFNANGYDHKFVLQWENNSTADEVEIDIICADM